MPGDGDGAGDTPVRRAVTRTRVVATGVKGVVEDKMRYYMTGGTVAVAFASIAAIVGGFFRRKRARKGGRR